MVWSFEENVCNVGKFDKKVYIESTLKDFFFDEEIITEIMCIAKVIIKSAMLNIKAGLQRILWDSKGFQKF